MRRILFKIENQIREAFVFKGIDAPQNWFNDPKDNYKDIVPESWIRL